MDRINEADGSMKRSIQNIINLFSRKSYKLQKISTYV